MKALPSPQGSSGDTTGIYGSVQDGGSRAPKRGAARAREAIAGMVGKLPEWMRLQRWKEYVIVVLTTQALFAIGKAMTSYKQYMPDDVNNQLNNFPVKLGDVWCTAKQLAPCSIGSPAIQAILSAAHGDCCDQLLAGALPHEQVTAWALAWIVLVVPPVLLLARHFVSKGEPYCNVHAQFCCRLFLRLQVCWLILLFGYRFPC